MKLRTQLALTFLALTILPLGGLAGYSYYTSSEAVRAALEEEAAELASQMDRKLASARQWVARSVANVEPITLDNLVDVEEEPNESQLARRIVQSMGSAAPLIRSFEYVPFEVSTSSSSSISSSTATSATDHAVPHVAPTPQVPHVAAAPPAPSAPGITPPAPPAPPSVVIDVRQALEQVRAEREQLEDAGPVGASIELAFEALESVPIDIIMEQSMKAMEEGFAEAEADLQAEAEQRGTEAKQMEIQEKQKALAEARARIQEIAAENAARQAEIRSEEGRTYVFRQAPAIPVVQNGEVVGSVQADVHDEEILREIFLTTSAQGDEIPFALDSSGKLFTRSEDDTTFLDQLPIKEVLESAATSRAVHEDWIIATSKDEESGLTLGVVRPAAEALAEVRKATLRSLALGLALVGICLAGVLPLANHMTRDITAVTAGAERISRGDLDTEVPVRSRNEVGRLAAVFNRMAGDLRTNQARLVEEESARHEQEMREHLLKSEYERTANELEEARQFQLSMLPGQLPESRLVDMAVEMTTATEVGGDYYDFHEDEDGLTIAIGDGTGHGAKAGTMVAVIKSLFTALHSEDLSGFLRRASSTIRSMQLGRMSMAMSLLRIRDGRVRYATAGMPPVYLCRQSDGTVEELSTPGAPLGTMEFPYAENEVGLQAGDVLVAMTDGLPELLDPSGEPFGYDRIVSMLGSMDRSSPQAIITALQSAAVSWRGQRLQNDDLTLLVARYRG